MARGKLRDYPFQPSTSASLPSLKHRLTDKKPLSYLTVMKVKCPKCKTGKARRICPKESHAEICSECCASIRDADCGDCVYYASTQKYDDQRSIPAVLPEGHFLMEINPEVEQAVDAALIQLEKGLTHQALSSLTNLLETYPQSYEVNYGIGTVHAVKGQPEKAIQWFDKAIAIYPYSVHAYYNRAMAYSQLLDLPNCIRSYQKVLILGDPREPAAQEARSFIAKVSASIWKEKHLSLDAFLEANELFNQAFALMEKNEWQAALDGFCASAAIDPTNAPSQGNIGLCLSYLGRRAEALAALDRALEINPDYEPARSNREVIEKLTEGTPLEGIDFKTIDYAKEKFKQK